MADDMTIRQLYELFRNAQEEQTEKLTKEINKHSNELNKKIDESHADIKILKNKCLSLERKVRKNNIVIFGLHVTKENELEDTLNAINKLLDIKLDKGDINNIQQVGKQDRNKGILIEFTSYLTKTVVFKNVYKLKNKGITITHDLCLEDQQRKKILIKHLKTAKSNNQRARLRGYKLEVEGKTYSVEELEREEAASECESDIVEEITEREHEVAERSRKNKTSKPGNSHIAGNKNSELQVNTRSASKKR